MERIHLYYNVYDINGHLYYELPNSELIKEDPMLNTNNKAQTSE
ncbi:MAG: hypothetical protein OXM61_15610 [Candidatus Poribacteria bacterium]|nr:hypothetical protein [Candidatus Poribacteria bacterium]